MSRTPRTSLFERLQKGLQESVAHCRGELTLKTVEVPEDPPQIDAATLAAIRRQVAMSQTVFAGLLSVSTKTLQSWEQGTRHPSDAALRLIQLFTQHPEIVCRSVGLPPVTLKGVSIKPTNHGGSKIVIENR
jgi:putative transcriptional regulator